MSWYIDSGEPNVLNFGYLYLSLLKDGLPLSLLVFWQNPRRLNALVTSWFLFRRTELDLFALCLFPSQGRVIQTLQL